MSLIPLTIRDKIRVPPVFSQFLAAQEIAPGVARETYRTVWQGADSGAARVVPRSSLWTYRDGRWQMIFHQGTKVPDA